MRIKFGSFGRPRDENLYERDDKRWRCCLCCHVRTGTILLGVWHLALHMLSLAAIAVLVLHPQVINQKSGIRIGGSYVNSDQDFLSILPTPLSAEITKNLKPFPSLNWNLVPITPTNRMAIIRPSCCTVRLFTRTGLARDRPQIIVSPTKIWTLALVSIFALSELRCWWFMVLWEGNLCIWCRSSVFKPLTSLSRVSRW